MFFMCKDVLMYIDERTINIFITNKPNLCYFLYLGNIILVALGV